MTNYYDNKVAQTAIATLALHLFFSFAKQASYTTHYYYIIILVATTTYARSNRQLLHDACMATGN
jgi:hypothetical protein